MNIREHLKISDNTLHVVINKLCTTTKKSTLLSRYIITRINKNSFNVTDGKISIGVDFDYIMLKFRCDPNLLLDNNRLIS